MADNLRIGIDELKKRMQAGENIIFIDTRNPQAWAQSDVMLPKAIRVLATISISTSTKFPKTGPSSPTALDRAKGPAPVWCRSFASVVTRMRWRSRVGLMHGEMRACQSNRRWKPLSISRKQR